MSTLEEKLKELAKFAPDDITKILSWHKDYSYDEIVGAVNMLNDFVNKVNYIHNLILDYPNLSDKTLLEIRDYFSQKVNNCKEHISEIAEATKPEC